MKRCLLRAIKRRSPDGRVLCFCDACGRTCKIKGDPAKFGRMCVKPGDGPVRIPAQARVPCQHLGKPTGAMQECDTCRGKAKIKLFACAVHGQCSIGKALPGIATCASCQDYSPSKRDEDADDGQAG